MFVTAQMSALVIGSLDLDCMVHKEARGSRAVECLGRYLGLRAMVVQRTEKKSTAGKKALGISA